jgi:alkyl hydroperoxide reductase subunit F
MSNKIYDLLIIGGGIAGITAAIYAARKEMKFAIISPEFGGEIQNTTYVENYPGFLNIEGKELANQFVAHLKKFNPEIIEDAVTEVKKTTENGQDIFWVTTYGGVYEAKTLIWATGSKYKSLNVPGEEELKSRGVTYCSICDGPLYKGKTVAIVGAGNNGLTTTIYMQTIAKKVYLLNKNPAVKGDPVLLDKIKGHNNIEILNNTTVKKINGDKKVESITIIENGVEKTIQIDGVIVNVGYTPITEPIKNIAKLNQYGYLEVNNKNMTEITGFFAAGDVVFNPYKQLVISASDGAKAALGAYDYLKSKQ